MSYTIPATIKNHRYNKVLGKIWREVNVENGIVTIVFCGKRGTGKSWSQVEWARLLDRDADDNCRFDDDSVCFSVSDFFTKLTGKYPRGKVICLDDAGLHMFNKDALADMLKRVSKTLQNIRYKHPIILLSLPYFKQLFIDAREMSDIYIEMIKRDKVRKQNLAAIQTLKVSAFTGDLYRYTIMQNAGTYNPELKLPITHWDPLPYRFDKPPDEIIKPYERKKSMFLDRFNQENLEQIKIKEDEIQGRTGKIHKLSFPAAVQYCKERIEEFRTEKGSIDPARIMLCVDEFGGQMFGQDQAKNIARVLR